MPHRLFFVVRHQRVLERIYPIEQDETTIGRSPESLLCLMDPYVSRRHAVIVHTSGGYLIRDLGSRNGTQLNDQPLGDAILSNTDHVQIGPYCLKAFDDAAAAQVDAETLELSTIHGYREIVPEGIRESLTPRQQRVFDQFLKGYSEKEVAMALGLSVNTVHTHARSIYAMFAVSSRSELLARCVPLMRR